MRMLPRGRCRAAARAAVPTQREPVTELTALLNRVLHVEPIGDGDHHATLNFLFDVCVDGRPVAVARLPSLYLYIGWPRLLRPLAPVFNHVALAWQALRGILAGRFAVIREFRNGPMLFVAPLLWPFRRRMVLVVHGNIPGSIHGGLPTTAFGLLVRLGFRFLLFDGELARSSITARYPRIRLYTPLFCVPDKRIARGAEAVGSRPFVLGMVGNFRAEKGGTEGAWKAVQRLSSIDNLRVAIGYRDPSLLESLPRENVDLVHTGSYDEYVRFMRSCDAMLFLGVPGAYEVRHSGALLDCLALGTPAVCPRFLLWESVVSRPVRVGETYAEDGEMVDAVRRLMADAEATRERFPSYYAGRAVAQAERVIAGVR